VVAAKLILSYHKPDVLLKDDILTPVHVGRTVARNRLGEDDPNLQWLLDNMVGDDTGDNISERNGSYNEMTSVYWAWKNYEQLGDPDYIGFMHYRRHFLFRDGVPSVTEDDTLGTDPNYLATVLGYSEEVLAELLTSSDFIYAKPQVRSTMREHFDTNHHAPDLDLMLSILREKFPKFEDAADSYLSGSSAIFCNMIILPKNWFMEYAEFVFGILLEVEERGALGDRRMFISEWLTGIFVTYLLKSGLNGRPLPIVVAEGEHTVPVVVAASPSYVLPLAVTLTSMLETGGRNTRYDISILVDDPYDAEVEARLLSLEQRYPGTKISFISVGDKFHATTVTTKHVKVNTYYRLLIPDLLPHLDRCIYLDTDVVVESDLTPLLRTVVDDKYLAGVYAAGYKPRPDEQAMAMGLPSYDRYVNAGVLLMNLRRIRRDRLSEQFMELSKQDFESDDQDVLNVSCYPDIRLLPPRFNLMTKYFPANKDEFFAYAGVRDTWTETEYKEAVRSPVVIHYADKRKPWLDASVDFADRWWHYGCLSPFAAEIMQTYAGQATAAAQSRVTQLRASFIAARRGEGAAKRELARASISPSGAQLAKLHDAVIQAARLDRECSSLKRALREQKKKTLQAKAQTSSVKRRLRDVRSSYSFKVGRALTAPLRAARILGGPGKKG
jgi:lipopolysaccharide biosynthesis glycosyltransferase